MLLYLRDTFLEVKLLSQADGTNRNIIVIANLSLEELHQFIPRVNECAISSYSTQYCWVLYYKIF